MPVEIKELHIRVAVSGKPPEAHGASGGAAKQAAAAGQAAGKDELVRQTDSLNAITFKSEK